MGRKKRKSTTDENEDEVESSLEPTDPPPPANNSAAEPSVTDARVKLDTESSGLRNPTPASLQPAVIDSNDGSTKDGPASSGYAMTSHSGEIIDEDIYVSDGSEDEDEDEVEMVLAGSRMGMMRRGIHHSMLVQPKRQWVRQDPDADGDGDEGKEDAEQKRLKEQEEELAKLDPAQRAARLLAEKQRKLEEAKEAARRLESEENAGSKFFALAPAIILETSNIVVGALVFASGDPCLFSKRTAFDIRFDQVSFEILPLS